MSWNYFFGYRRLYKKAQLWLICKKHYQQTKYSDLWCLLDNSGKGQSDFDKHKSLHIEKINITEEKIWSLNLFLQNNYLWIILLYLHRKFLYIK